MIDKEEIDTKLQVLKEILPEVFDSWKHPYQAFFHLTEDIAGKIDGNLLENEQILLYSSNKITIYDHTYGCPTKCNYCGYFTKSPPDTRKTLEKHMGLKEKEREIILRKIPNLKISSMYFGGGTPTILPPYLLKRLIQGYREFKISKNAEITVEAHPRTIKPSKLEVLADNGVNRVSMGIQSLNPAILKDCNRKYSPEEAIDILKLAKNKIPVVNVDVIYGLKNQTSEDHLETLRILTDLGVDQITAYALWLKEGSVIHKDFSQNQTQNYPNPEERVKMYFLTKSFLEDQGYEETIIGWFSKPNKKVKIYSQRWEEKIPCLGIGAGSYSYGEDWHYNNVKDWQKYTEMIDEQKLPIKNAWRFGPKEKILTQLMWKIKTGQKFSLNNQEEKLLIPFIDKKLIEKSKKERFKISDLGRPICEYIIGNLIEKLSQFQK